MSHFDIVEWTDYVRGLGDPVSRKRMAAHLESGCRQCGDIVETLEAVAADGRAETGPPPWALRSVLAYFSVGESHARDRLERLPARVAFDSHLQPALPGVRNRGGTGRHLVFNARQYTVDTRLDYGGGRGLSVVGQVVARGGEPVARIPAYLVSAGEIVSRDLTNRHGEFQMDCARRGALRLCLSIGERQVIEIELARRPPGEASEGLPSWDPDRDRRRGSDAAAPAAEPDPGPDEE